MSKLDDAIRRRAMVTRLIGSERFENDRALVTEAAEKYANLEQELVGILETIVEYETALRYYERLDELAEVKDSPAARVLRDRGE